MTIEDKATAYAEKEMENVYSEEWDSEYVEGLLENAFYDGATEALSSQWVSVEERMPEEDVRILGRNKGSVFLCTFDGEDFYNVMPDFKVHPTHWMPIPELPTEGGEQ